jgi:hypothetical protein
MNVRVWRCTRAVPGLAEEGDLVRVDMGKPEQGVIVCRSLPIAALSMLHRDAESFALLEGGPGGSVQRSPRPPGVRLMA